MEIQLTPEEQTQLVEVAQRVGKNVEDIARDAIKSFLRGEAAFVTMVEEGLASLDRGEHLSHEEVGSRIDKLFQA
jgi:predicted transcriptional regulator